MLKRVGQMDVQSRTSDSCCLDVEMSTTRKIDGHVACIRSCNVVEI